jgi:glucose-1-phosphatase
MVSPTIKNLIFDLGGVILNLSVERTLQSFAALSGIPASQVQEIFRTAPGFNEYEKGAMNDEGFRDFVRKVYSVQVADHSIDKCWNAMLGEIPPAKLELLTRLKDRYRVLLLSNTNGIHLNHINTVTLAGKSALDTYFHNAYYSHRMLKRKPDAEIFEQVMNENGLLPEETLFLDDSAMNIQGARALGIQTVHVTTPDLILDYFHA